MESNQQQGPPHGLQPRPLSTCVGYTHLKHDKGSNERLTGSNTATTETLQVSDISCEATPNPLLPHSEDLMHVTYFDCSILYRLEKRSLLQLVYSSNPTCVGCCQPVCRQNKVLSPSAPPLQTHRGRCPVHWLCWHGRSLVSLEHWGGWIT